MPKVSVEYKEAKRREIAAAALRTFQRKGFHAASMADIIAESGASAGAIYGSFRSKTELVHAVATTMVNDRLLAGEASIMADPLPLPGEVVGLMMRGMTEELGSSDVLVQLWGESVTDPQLLDITRDIMDRIDDLYQRYLTRWHEARGTSHAESTAAAARLSPILVSVSQGYILQSAIRQNFDGEAYLSAAAEFLPR